MHRVTVMGNETSDRRGRRPSKCITIYLMESFLLLQCATQFSEISFGLCESNFVYTMSEMWTDSKMNGEEGQRWIISASSVDGCWWRCITQNAILLFARLIASFNSIWMFRCCQLVCLDQFSLSDILSTISHCECMQFREQKHCDGRRERERDEEEKRQNGIKMHIAMRNKTNNAKNHKNKWASFRLFASRARSFDGRIRFAPNVNTRRHCRYACVCLCERAAAMPTRKDFFWFKCDCVLMSSAQRQ